MNNELPYSVLMGRLRQLKASEVVINPCLAVLDASDRFAEHVPAMFALEARNFSNNCLTESDIIQHFNTLLNPSNFPIIALCEIFASTALLIAHEQTGNLFVDESIARKAMSKVKDFCDNTSGILSLLQLYQMITTHTNLNALSYYDGIPEQEFLLGDWHRPWARHFLNDDLKLGTSCDIMEVISRKGQRYIQITPKGVEALQSITQMLDESGYFSQRVALLHISQFNTFDEYEKLAENIWPQFMDCRRQFLDFTDIKPGMKVLELGCGTGLFTFETGLADRIGSNGKLVCTDPSAKMINQAKAKPQAKNKDWVEFYVSIAEELPFADGSFDAVLGCAFLHYTNRDLALKEMRRVTRPGGIIASFHPLTYNLTSTQFFHEWFYPIFQLAAKRKEQPRSCYFSFEEGLESVKKIGLTNIEIQTTSLACMFHDLDTVIKHCIHGLGLYQEELADLPWKAREDIMEELKERGVSICQKYTTEERIVHWPCQVMKGINP